MMVWNDTCCLMARIFGKMMFKLPGEVEGGAAGETKDRREHEADKSFEWRGRFGEHHQAD